MNKDEEDMTPNNFSRTSSQPSRCSKSYPIKQSLISSVTLSHTPFNPLFIYLVSSFVCTTVYKVRPQLPQFASVVNILYILFVLHILYKVFKLSRSQAIKSVCVIHENNRDSDHHECEVQNPSKPFRLESHAVSNNNL